MEVRICGKGKFWVWSGTEMEWCIMKVMMMMMMNWWEGWCPGGNFRICATGRVQINRLLAGVPRLQPRPSVAVMNMHIAGLATVQCNESRVPCNTATSICPCLSIQFSWYCGSGRGAGGEGSLTPTFGKHSTAYRISDGWLGWWSETGMTSSLVSLVDMMWVLSGDVMQWVFIRVDCQQWPPTLYQ